VCLAALVFAPAGCAQLTETELRTILAGSGAATTVAAVNTAVTSSIGPLLQAVLTRWMNNLLGVRPILR
jgi:hypothetical protein